MMSKERIDIAAEVDTKMTNVQAAACLIELHAECEARLRQSGRELKPKYAEAVALAIMALNNYEY
jgi:hypothetical protein